MIVVFRYNLITRQGGGEEGGGGLTSREFSFGRKTKFFRESEDFAGNWETREIFREIRSNEVKSLGSLRIFGNAS